MAKSPEEYAHLEWLGYVQPVGLVVSVPAMLQAQCYVNKNIIGEHARFLSCLRRDKHDAIIPEISDFAEFTRKVLEWEEDDLREIPQRVALPEELSSLEVILPQYHETLRPTHAVPAFQPKEDESPWMMLTQDLPADTDFDDPSEADSSRHWHAAPQMKFERLLRESKVPIGLLYNSRQLRLVYAPRGESSGHATFNVDEMVQVAGRPMFAALQMLLSAERMFSLGEKQRLPAVLANSRKYQNTVSTKLAEQVLAALYELMRGFQAANDVRKGELLKDVLENDPNQVYSGLLRVLMRLVFVMYAEDRDLMSSDPVYSNHYSVTGLFDRLRSDAGRFPDTMDQRFGAWSQLLALFRLVYEGGQHATFKLPARKGYLFDPDRYPFLEGRTTELREGESQPVPRISDGVVFRVLRNLLILDGERLSYRTLDVEQIGSVYETIMGFNLETAQGKSIAIKPVISHGAPATINLDALLETPGKDRAKWIKECTDQKITGEALKALKAAESIDELLTALDKKIHKTVTPRLVTAGAIVLQPSDERRRSGSHYTPRSLTEPIVRTTLAPILKQLVEPPQDEEEDEKTLLDTKGRKTKAQVVKSERDEEAARLAQEKGSPHPRQILNLKVCDPAMGSGAFLVEACRQLGDELVAAWNTHECVPTDDIPPDEDEVLYARRLIAQRCLYGVDKNSMAVDLSKLSLWLVTLAKDHPFTFLDHSLRHGDSLVGLAADQISNFTWDLKPSKKARSHGLTFKSSVQARLEKATEHRRRILDAREDIPYRDQEKRMRDVDEQLDFVRVVGDACVSAFFSEAQKKAREERCDELFDSLSAWISNDLAPQFGEPIVDAAGSLRNGDFPLTPFHWEIEFPEVFGRKNGGFDAFVGNPPFAGKNTLLRGSREGFLEYLKTVHAGTHGNSDVVAHFFRRAFDLLSQDGCLGLIATNTIRQGDTRTTGLRWIRVEGHGNIFSAKRRLVWPGLAAVIVSVVCIRKSEAHDTHFLDGKSVPTITAYLFYEGSDEDPQSLATNAHKCFVGVQVHGLGFTFDDNSLDSGSNSLAEREAFLEDARNQDIIKPLIGWQEITNSLLHLPTRSVIDFSEYNETESRQWPDLFDVVESKVKPARMRDNRAAYRNYWWQFAEKRPELTLRKKTAECVLTCSAKATTHLSFVRLPAEFVFTNAVNVILDSSHEMFCVLQSRPHELWARFFGSSMKDDLTYANSVCFETFPFPSDFNGNLTLVSSGEQYYEFRVRYMTTRSESLTATYNRFHDPHETSPEIKKLQELHDEMDRAVLRAYGWDDLSEKATCDFLLDYEEEEDDDPTAKKSKKKKPWRYRWPDEFRDEVLGRLLELNEQRAKEEKLTGETAEAKSTSAGGRK